MAAIYFLTQRRGRAETASLVSTLVLITVLLAMVSIVIGNNTARAFGLAGVLSIIRFRTVVEDTRDTAFVIFAVITGMAVGSGLLEDGVDPPAHRDAVDDRLDARLDLRGHPVGEQ